MFPWCGVGDGQLINRSSLRLHHRNNDFPGVLFSIIWDMSQSIYFFIIISLSNHHHYRHHHSFYLTDSYLTYSYFLGQICIYLHFQTQDWFRQIYIRTLFLGRESFNCFRLYPFRIKHNNYQKNSWQASSSIPLIKAEFFGNNIMVMICKWYCCKEVNASAQTIALVDDYSLLYFKLWSISSQGMIIIVN